MTGNLLIVESPSKATTLKKYLGPDFEILASYGHVRDLEAKGGAVNPDVNFGMRYALIERNEKHLQNIIKSAAKSKTIYLATDPDREGEAIAWHLAEILVGDSNIDKNKLCRVVFYEITKSAVVRAVKNPRKISMDLVNAQQARRALDHLVGFNLSPLLWKKVGRNLSAGRVQTPALRLIVEREQEIEKFVKQEYWTIHFEAGESNKKFGGRLVEREGKKLEQFSIPDGGMCKSILSSIKSKTNGEITITNITKKPKTRKPSPPFITSTLQQEGIRKLGFSAKETMIVAQQLYEGIDTSEGSIGLISYMRTDSLSLSKEAVTDIRTYIKEYFDGSYLPTTENTYKSKSKNAQEAHEAIRPTLITRTPLSLKKHLTAAQFSLYDLIWKRTVACQMTEAKFETTSIDFLAPDKNCIFRTSGQTLIFDGFSTLYSEGKKSDSEEVQLPKLSHGQKISVDRFYEEQHFTQPPPRYGEASLVKTLEDYGIGRPSTYASIITTLQDRGYALLDKKRFTPTDVGRLVNGFLFSHFNEYLEYNFTARLEQELDEISNGKQNWTDVMSEFWGKFSVDLDKKDDVKRGIPLPAATPVARSWVTFSLAQSSQEKNRGNNLGQIKAERCPKCSTGKLLLQNSARGLFVGCSNYPECNYTDPFGSGSIVKEPILLGEHPDLKKPIKLMGGPYGPYVQLGEQDETSKKKPKRASWPKGISLPHSGDEESLVLAIKLLSLPRVLGIHPETKKQVETSIGRFGPYIKHDGAFKSIPKGETPYDISLQRALEILAQPSINGRAGKPLGQHPDDSKTVTLHKGKYGPYVKHGKINATVTSDIEPDDVTLEIALTLLAQKAVKTPKKRAAKKPSKKR